MPWGSRRLSDRTTAADASHRAPATVVALRRELQPERLTVLPAMLRHDAPADSTLAMH
jgi:hypothetical protein